MRHRRARINTKINCMYGLNKGQINIPFKHPNHETLTKPEQAKMKPSLERNTTNVIHTPSNTTRHIVKK